MSTVESVVETRPHGAPRKVAALTWRALGAIAVGLVAGALLVTVAAVAFFDFRVLNVTSGSMAPAIEAGDLVVVKPAPIHSIRAGDIVLFESGGDDVLTVHRVVGVNEIALEVRDASGAVSTTTEMRLVTRGDANPAPDNAEVTAGQLRGEVWFTVPNAGALGGRGMVTASGVLLGVAIAAWAAFEAALKLRDRRRN
jgi:signal peptidase